MTEEADQEALDADTQDPALDQMIAAETVDTMADEVTSVETVEKTEGIVPIAETETETTDAQDLPLLAEIEAVAPLAETTRSLTNHISLRTIPKRRNTTTINPALLFATIELIFTITLTNPTKLTFKYGSCNLKLTKNLKKLNEQH